MEKLRNWYKINIAPVLPCLRMNRKSIIYAVCILGLFLFALNDIQIVWGVSRVLESNAAESGTLEEAMILEDLKTIAETLQIVYAAE